MLVKALKSFAGKLSMYTGETRDIADDEIAKDLLRAGYIEKVGAKAEQPKVIVPKVEEPTIEKPKKTRKTRKK